MIIKPKVYKALGFSHPTSIEPTHPYLTPTMSIAPSHFTLIKSSCFFFVFFCLRSCSLLGVSSLQRPNSSGNVHCTQKVSRVHV